MINKLKNYSLSLYKNIFFEEIHKELTLKAKRLSIKNKHLSKIKNLSEVEFQVYSQWGEDGIIDWLINKFRNIPKNFLEIGTEDYKESNTRFLLTNKNWDGFLIEGDKIAVKNIKSQRVYWKHNLKIKNEYVNKENINTVIKNLKVPKKLGLLSLDIDGIDYWVLKELSQINPTIIICEFNSLFGIKNSITVPYKKNFNRSKEHYSYLYYGASIQAFINILKKKKYYFLGTNSAGNNAFFIQNKFSTKAKKIISNNKIFISKFRESRNKKNKLNHLGKEKSLKLIQNKLVLDLTDSKIKKISDLKL